jgi:hypothetical protein
MPGAQSGYAIQTETGSDVSKMNMLQRACFNFENCLFPLVCPCFPAAWRWIRFLSPAGEGELE